MNLETYRASDREQLRTRDLLTHVPATGNKALDIGARDGYFSRLLAERFDHVVALDLTVPDIAHPKVSCIKGNAAALEFDDGEFDFVFCAEVLEHIPTHILGKACAEIERVTDGHMLIGVPYRQDIRVGRTTCVACGGRNPPYGHVNSFDESRLESLFTNSVSTEIGYVGHNPHATNSMSAFLMDLAGNPYGTYDQEEPCIHCNRQLVTPPKRNLMGKILTKIAFLAQKPTALLSAPHAIWIHVLFEHRLAVR